MREFKLDFLIVDDEILARNRIRNLLKIRPEVSAIHECANGVEAVSFLLQQQVDILFLDIQMPDLDGFGVLRELEGSPLPIIVFTTAYDQFALRAFEVHALDYLLKPFDDDRFKTMLERAISQVKKERAEAFQKRIFGLLREEEPPQAEEVAMQERERNARFVVKSAGRICFVPAEEVEWIDAAGVYVQLHTKTKTHLLRDTMNRLETQLDPEKFARIHRSTIVNLNLVETLLPKDHGDYFVLLKNGKKLRLSRSYRESILEKLGV